MILLPTKSRPQSLQRYINNYHKCDGNSIHVVIVESDDKEIDAYRNIDLPKNWVLREYIGGKGAATHFNKVYNEFPNEEYYAFVSDDCIPKTKVYDKILCEAVIESGTFFAWPNDGEYYDRFASHGWISGHLVKHVGNLNPLDLNHFGLDNFWFHLGSALGAKYFHSVILEHMHPRLGKANIDSTYKEQALQRIPSDNPDSSKWRAFRRSGEWNNMVTKIKEMVC